MTKTDPTPAASNSADDKAAAARALVAHLHQAVDALERLLTGEDHAHRHSAVLQREVLKPGEYADRLRVSVGHVHRWIKKGMPHFKVEGRARIRVKEADAWLATVAAQAPTDE